VYDWNLADPFHRNGTIDEIGESIEDIVIPYFSLFENIPSLIIRCLNSDIPSFTIDNVIQFLLCYSDVTTAQTAGKNFLLRRPTLVRSYRRDYARFTDRGIDYRSPTTYASQLALASHLFKLGDLSPSEA